MSNSEHPDVVAFRELEQLVRALGEELAGFRKRALLAEARLKEIESGAVPASAPRVKQLEHENAELTSRLERASARTRDVLDRVHFLRQQTAPGADR